VTEIALTSHVNLGHSRIIISGMLESDGVFIRMRIVGIDACVMDAQHEDESSQDVMSRPCLVCLDAN
jgi:hypothetical protein